MLIMFIYKYDSSSKGAVHVKLSVQTDNTFNDNNISNNAIIKKLKK